MDVYDFDGTLYRGDSTADFVAWCLRRYPHAVRTLPRTALAAAGLGLGAFDKTRFKSALYRLLPLVPNIESELGLFWNAHERRRFRRWLDGDEKFSALPQLLLIDGGAGQVKAAEAAMEVLGIHVPAFGMVKDDRHRTRALVTGDGREIGIQHNQSLFSMIGRIQEETHRFAIEFHRQQQSERVKGSALDGIEGVGPVRKKELLKHFKSIRAIREAGEEALAAVVPRNTARAVYRHFHKGE